MKKTTRPTLDDLECPACGSRTTVRGEWVSCVACAWTEATWNISVIPPAK